MLVKHGPQTQRAQASGVNLAEALSLLRQAGYPDPTLEGIGGARVLQSVIDGLCELSMHDGLTMVSRALPMPGIFAWLLSARSIGHPERGKPAPYLCWIWVISRLSMTHAGTQPGMRGRHGSPISMTYLGAIPVDASVERSVCLRKLLMISAPQSAAAKAILELATTLENSGRPTPDTVMAS